VQTDIAADSGPRFPPTPDGMMTRHVTEGSNLPIHRVIIGPIVAANSYEECVGIWDRFSPAPSCGVEKIDLQVDQRLCSG
jgi:hypothetical protein